ncbi:MAG: hypothetical protein UT92_C0009G0005 [Candidatus Curtissbacteria bacterium GW2011_GWA1_40_24]|uniref:Uncharacterized protein n=1 Tax=Candidatus Curtissbacteria bacterium GW2011_GWA1_40_24 TaxID=1618406 RepID=A0A0G0RR44_9BACT|nr:MAG: hypothetical protein UT92_C0009G0005 [Candidatus Curtissbacteria bacterium GW2011_GWA1_40_24]
MKLLKGLFSRGGEASEPFKVFMGSQTLVFNSFCFGTFNFRDFDDIRPVNRCRPFHLYAVLRNFAL